MSERYERCPACEGHGCESCEGTGFWGGAFPPDPLYLEYLKKRKKRMQNSPTTKEIFTALAKAQKNIGAAAKGAKNPFFRSTYADLGSVMEAIKEPLNEAGVAILQPAYTEGDYHFLETLLVHESGEWVSSGVIKLILVKNDMQSLGSAITYARRYQLQSLIALPAEDDDGNKASGRDKPESQNSNTIKPKEKAPAMQAAIQSVEKNLAPPSYQDSVDPEQHKLAVHLNEFIKKHTISVHVYAAYMHECKKDKISKLSVVQLHTLKELLEEYVNQRPMNKS
jgi:hypothetical protein